MLSAKVHRPKSTVWMSEGTKRRVPINFIHKITDRSYCAPSSFRSPVRQGTKRKAQTVFSPSKFCSFFSPLSTRPRLIDYILTVLSSQFRPRRDRIGSCNLDQLRFNCTKSQNYCASASVQQRKKHNHISRRDTYIPEIS